MYLPRFIRKLVKHTDNELSRYALGGVYFESGAGKVRVTATDGKQLVTVTREDESASADNAFIMDAKPLDKAVQYLASGKPKAPVSVESDGDKAKLSVITEDATVPLIDGRYPNIQQAMDHCRPEQGSTAYVDAKLLKRFCETVIDATKSNPKAIIGLTVSSDGDKALGMGAIADDGAVIRGLLMPLAGDDRTTLPEVDFTHDPLDADSEDDSEEDIEGDASDNSLAEDVAAVGEQFVNGVMPA